MNFKPINLDNYYLTETGVINKLDTHWDKLHSITSDLEKLSNKMIRTLFNNLTISLLMIIFIFWIDMEKTVSLLSLGFVVICSVLWSAYQLTTYWEFGLFKERGKLLYKELVHELELSETLHFDYDLPLEERILLNNFILASEAPLNPVLYFIFTALAPITAIGFMSFYYFLV